MTSRERMLTAYKGGRPDRVPVSPELWDAAALDVIGRPFHKVVGPYAEEPFWRMLLRVHDYYGTDAWVCAAPDSPAKKEGRIQETHRFLDDETIESEICYKTTQGDLHEVTRTTRTYAGWTMEHPVKDFAVDMPKYEECYFSDPWKYDVTEIETALEETGERGLVTVWLGSLFLSVLGSAIEGGMIQALMDVTEHPEYSSRLHDRYLKHVAEITRMVLTRTKAEAVFIDSGYSQVPVVSPAVFREWEVPVLETVSNVAHERGIPLHLHVHGKVFPILEDIIAGGADIICGLFSPPTGDVTDLSELRRACRGRLALKGNIDPFGALLTGDPRAVEREVRECLEEAGPEGGFILGTQDSTVSGTPSENLFAFVKAGRRHGTYSC
ncbi:MAG: hypothetical protein HYY08_03630 [Firmicutes bacterium]|nr:hypothetical protein [Bacillota bacterium]